MWHTIKFSLTHEMAQVPPAVARSCGTVCSAPHFSRASVLSQNGKEFAKEKLDIATSAGKAWSGHYRERVIRDLPRCYFEAVEMIAKESGE
ncbi:hypothetical protein R1sor_002969 [Riccia sorocarpa]|uniref:Uncharacterized protein n=1 Tax=Riccia sorocarpa TaxID=122646 RepID=A0ABD3H0A2_9MARC